MIIVCKYFEHWQNVHFVFFIVLNLLLLFTINPSNLTNHIQEFSKKIDGSFINLANALHFIDKLFKLLYVWQNPYVKNISEVAFQNCPWKWLFLNIGKILEKYQWTSAIFSNILVSKSELLCMYILIILIKLYVMPLYIFEI